MFSYPYILISSYHHILIFSYPHIIIFSYPHILISSYSHVLMFSYPHIFAHLHFLIYPHILIFSYPHIFIFSYPHVLISSYTLSKCISEFAKDSHDDLIDLDILVKPHPDGERQRRATPVNVAYLWPSNTVPYVYDTNSPISKFIPTLFILID